MTKVQWLSPSPLWGDLAAESDKTRYRRPSLLRFATDTFMEDLEALLALEPSDVKNVVAEVENWRQPSAGLLGGTDAPGLKLYQPVHSRFYLISASLVCRLPGMPDHSVHPEQNETVSFLLRRRSGGQEFGFVPGKPDSWIPVNPEEPAEGEELLPMFPY